MTGADLHLYFDRLCLFAWMDQQVGADGGGAARL
jgi:hypothetical protein